jgi:hypothetical protein
MIEVLHNGAQQDKRTMMQAARQKYISRAQGAIF